MMPELCTTSVGMTTVWYILVRFRGPADLAPEHGRELLIHRFTSLARPSRWKAFAPRLGYSPCTNDVRRDGDYPNFDQRTVGGVDLVIKGGLKSRELGLRHGLWPLIPIPGQATKHLTGNGEKLTYSPAVGCNWLCLAGV